MESFAIFLNIAAFPRVTSEKVKYHLASKESRIFINGKRIFV